MHRLGPLLQLARVAEAQADVVAAERVAEHLRQPAHLWDVWGGKAMLAIALGRLDEGERLAEEALALGQRAQPEIAIPVYRTQRYTLRDFRGGLEEVEAEIHELAAERPARPVFRCVLAHVHARIGRLPEARRTLEELTARECAALPFDQEWLFGMSCLAETAALLDDADVAGRLYTRLEPWARLDIVDQCEAMRGAATRYLGLLGATTREWEAAERHFDDALARNARTGLRPWVVRTQEDYARMLRGRGDGERARALGEIAEASRRELGMADGWARSIAH
jgi:tetratricopeptide (TPR) repeat protein